MDAITEAIDYFKGNIPIHLKYSSVEEYIFTEKDKSEIQEYITLLETSTNPPTGIYFKALMLEFIGELVKDRVNESRPNGILPILEY